MTSSRSPAADRGAAAGQRRLGAAEAEARAAEAAAPLERLALATFDRVYVCSEADRQALGGPAAAALYVLPNALPLLAPPAPPKSVGGPFIFLFVGTLGYYPNEDAVLFFGGEIPAAGRPGQSPRGVLPDRR